MRSFADHFGVLAMLSRGGGILVGATVGTADVTSGVFRDLVVTGRSRLDLYAARVPAGLALVLLAAAAGFAIVVATGLRPAQRPPRSTASAPIAPTAGTLVNAGLWLALVGAVSFALSLRRRAPVVGSAGPARSPSCWRSG